MELCCGAVFNTAVCPECLLDPRGSTAKELRDLEAAARTVQALLEYGGLEKAACEQVYERIEARQRLLLNVGRMGVLPLTEDASRLLLRLERWLGGETPGRELSVEQNREILRGYRLLTEKDLVSLSPAALLGLARLLAKVGVTTRALNAYRLVMNEPGALDATPVGVEAGCLAFNHEQWRQARWFLERALARPEAVAANPEALALWNQLRARANREPEGTPGQTELVPMFLLEPGQPAGSAEQAPPVALAPSVADNACAPVPQPAAETPPSAAAAPRRSLAEWLAVFMEE